MFYKLFKGAPVFFENFLMILGIVITLLGVPFAILCSFYYILNASYTQALMSMAMAVVLVYINQQYSKRS